MNIKINKRIIGTNFEPLIVPEIGINHNGSLELIFKMIDKLSEIGAECIKFQCFSTDEFMGPNKTTYSYFSKKKKRLKVCLKCLKGMNLIKKNLTKFFLMLKKKR